jgi:hypothetical protein
MTKLSLTIVFFSSFFSDIKVPTGKFSNTKSYDRYEIKIKPDHTFQQKVGSCLWTYVAVGTWTTKQDTMILTGDKIRDAHGVRNKKFQDTSSYLFRFFKHYDKLLITNTDTITQLFKFHDTIFKIKLGRQY